MVFSLDIRKIKQQTYRIIRRVDIKDLIIRDIALPLVVVGLIICVGIWSRHILALCIGIFLAALAQPDARITRYFPDYSLIAAFLASGIISQLFVWRASAPGTIVEFQFWVLSGLLIIVGLVQLCRFLHKYPKPEREVSNDN